ncbi:MAG: hypothetical protein L0H84_12350, partial [Pseudonocardia sp.]|nr:hypothetical protein [Pseudonocardia sp.]
MRNEAVEGMFGEWGAVDRAARRGSAQQARRRAAGPRPVRPVAAAPAARPPQRARPGGRTTPVAVAAGLRGEPRQERTVVGRGGRRVPIVRSGSGWAGWRVLSAAATGRPDDAVRRFLAGLALMMVVAVVVVLLGMLASLAGAA